MSETNVLPASILSSQPLTIISAFLGLGIIALILVQKLQKRLCSPLPSTKGWNVRSQRNLGQVSFTTCKGFSQHFSLHPYPKPPWFRGWASLHPASLSYINQSFGPCPLLAPRFSRGLLVCSCSPGPLDLSSLYFPLSLLRSPSFHDSVQSGLFPMPTAVLFLIPTINPFSSTRPWRSYVLIFIQSQAFKLSKLTPVDILPSTKPCLLNFAKSTINWRPSVQMAETMEEISLKPTHSTLCHPQTHNHIVIKNKCT